MLETKFLNLLAFDDLVAAYYQQIEGLVDGGIDIILIETIFDTLNAKAAIYATLDYFDKKNTELPVFVCEQISSC
jgi:5-methyltetrahydrofolate--homocysteine methyltransferase